MTILSEAENIITGDRQECYGDPRVNLQRVAEQWGMYLSQKNQLFKQIILTQEDICWMMTLLKMCRQMHAPKRDNLVDAAGYIGLIEKVLPTMKTEG